MPKPFKLSRYFKLADVIIWSVGVVAIVVSFLRAFTLTSLRLPLYGFLSHKTSATIAMGRLMPR